MLESAATRPSGRSNHPGVLLDVSVSSPPYALIGWPLDFSLSPAMHRAALAEAGIAGDYQRRPTPPADLPDALDALRRGELAGLNVTVPHKLDVLPLVEESSDLVIGLGAANTLVRGASGRLRAENTDGVGFRFALEAAGALEGHGRHALLVGAGGAARAVGYVLVRAGYRLTVLARRSGQSAILVGQLYRALPGAPLATDRLDEATLVRLAAEADLLVHATPLGGLSAPDASPWPEAAPWPASLALIDIVAWPLDTPLMRQARAAGAPVQGGLDMLVAQAARSFRIWTGLASPVETMRRAALTAAREAGASLPPELATG